ncbi:prepilin-type N-terminal cleavage/methylation domain-containing protein [Isachenkonia alkalipeptolytica]|nr:prepilin-type N-terminal cleavage/methylation domain-containing protein [Isachenkonia alkalipeptolytica]
MNILGSKKGLTLIEVIIALAILGIIAVSFLAMFSQGLSGIFAMGDKTDATRVAQEFMDQYYEDSLDENITNAQGEIVDYTRKGYTVNSSISSGPQGMREVTVTVSYRRGTRTTSLTALVP